MKCETPPCTYFHLFARIYMIIEQLQIEHACHTTDSGRGTAYSMESNSVFLSSAQNEVNKNLSHTLERLYKSHTPSNHLLFVAYNCSVITFHMESHYYQLCPTLAKITFTIKVIPYFVKELAC